MSERMLARARAALGAMLVLASASGCGSSHPEAGSESAALSVTASGSVRDVSGGGIADAQIDFLQGGIVLGSATTDLDGAWSVEIEDGVYDVAITPPPGSIYAPQTLFAQLVEAETTFHVVLVSGELVTFTAHVRDRDGAGLPESWVCMDGLGGSTCETTDAAGDVQLEIAHGSYDLGVTIWDWASSPAMPESVWVSMPLTLTGDTAETITVANRALTGVVLDADGNPVPNASISARGWNELQEGFVEFNDWAHTDSSGRFAIGALPGEVEINVTPELESGLVGTAIVTQVDAETGDVVITLPRTVLWTGQLLDRDATPLVSVHVCLRASRAYCGETDAAGYARIAAPPDTYRLDVEFLPAMFVNPQLPEGTVVSMPGPTLTDDTTETVTIENRTLTGVVVDADGAPVPNATVSARIQGETPDGWAVLDDQVHTDSSGRFAVRVLRGTVEIHVVVRGAAGFFATTSLSTVVQGDSDIVVALPRRVTWTGRLRDREGTPLAFLSVCLDGETGSACGDTDPAGEVQLAVVPGSYSISVTTIDPSTNPQLPMLMFLPYPGPTLTDDASDTIVVENRTLTGVVVDVDGNPVPNVSLWVNAELALPAGWGGFADSAQTDASGRFELSVLQATAEMQAVPDPASGLDLFALQGIVVDGDTSLAVLLQFATDSIEAPVGAGETVGTDHELDGATPADPVETAVTLPVPGTVEIQEAPITTGVPTGYAFLTQQVNVTAPPSTADAPLVITFAIDGSRIPLGQDETTLEIFRNGVLVPECTGPEGVASPDPCVASRALVGDDVAITVLTSAASEWNFGVRRIGDADQDGILDDVDACPAEPEDADGHLDADGCPDLDDDLDGVPDAIDLCPREPEDLDGFEDDDGCAEIGPETGATCPDLDGDGQVTVRDQTAVARAMGSSLGEPRYRADADLDRDGDVDVSDLHLLLPLRGTSCAQ